MNELDLLKDIHLPAKINMLPLAPGWLILFTFLIAVIFYFLFIWWKKQRRKLAVKYALAKLNQLQRSMIENPNNINIAAEVSTLLRRTALHYFPREQIASLTGQQWIDFLNRSGKNNIFSADIAALLTHAPYQKEIVNDLTPLFNMAHVWLIAISKTVGKEKSIYV